MNRAIAVVGGGINGVMSAWMLAAAGHRVEVFERASLMSETSSASTKLLHGGLRYLEQRRFGLVREGLVERAWWLHAAPHLTRRIELVLPLYRDSPRGKFTLKAGLTLYDLLAGKDSIGAHRWVNASTLLRASPQIKREGLRGGFIFYDGQMNDRALGLWAADRARHASVQFHESTSVEKVNAEGEIIVNGEVRQFDFVVNAAGPWAGELLARSGVKSHHELDLVRGSHIVFDEPLQQGFVLQAPRDHRVCFVLPYEGRTLLGTTEVRQSVNEPVRPSADEVGYLLDVFNRYFQIAKSERDIAQTFAGLRPLVRSGGDATRMSRECAIEVDRRLISIFGGKWTSARALGQRVTRSVLERSARLV